MFLSGFLPRFPWAVLALQLLALPALAQVTNLAAGCPYVVQATFPDSSWAATESGSYPDTGGIELTDGQIAQDSDGLSFHDPKWVGWRGQDWRVITIDLKRVASVRYVVLDCCQYTAAGIYFPKWVGTLVSLDGVHWKGPARSNSKISLAKSGWLRQSIQVNLIQPQDARYVQVAVPVDAWTFADEVQVWGIPLSPMILDGTALPTIVAEKRGLLFPVPPIGWTLPGTDRTGGARHICLIYCSGDSAKATNLDSAFFRPYAGHANRYMLVDDTLFDSFLFLPYASAPGGRNFGIAGTPSIASDWQSYLGQIFLPGYQLSALDSAVGLVRTQLKRPGTAGVIIGIPYPSPKQTSFGDVDGSGRSLNFADATNGQQDRLAAVQWYIDQALQRWQAAGFRNLTLIGFYWYEESAPPTDEQVLMGTSAALHARGLRFFWIPYYFSPGFRNWGPDGFDCAMLQPNYSFTTIPVSQAATRLVPAALLAARYGLGMEMEVGYDLNDPAVRGRYLAYLVWGRKLGYARNSVISYYQNTDSFRQMAVSANPQIRMLYDETYRFVKGIGY